MIKYKLSQIILYDAEISLIEFSDINEDILVHMKNSETIELAGTDAVAFKWYLDTLGPQGGLIDVLLLWSQRGPIEAMLEKARQQQVSLQSQVPATGGIVGQPAFTAVPPRVRGKVVAFPKPRTPEPNNGVDFSQAGMPDTPSESV